LEAVSSRTVFTTTGMRNLLRWMQTDGNLHERHRLERPVEPQHEIERIEASAQLEVALGRPIAGGVEELRGARRLAQPRPDGFEIARLAEQARRDQLRTRVVFVAALDCMLSHADERHTPG